MNMEGDGPQDQPAEGVLSLDALAEGMDEEAAPEESEEGEESDESEESEAEEEGEESEEQEEEPTVVIKHDGKDVILKQSEALALAQQGFDYSKKTMALAEERKALEPLKAEAEHYRKQHYEALDATVQRLMAFEQFVKAEIGEPPPIEWAQQDAAYYLAQKELHESRKGKLGQVLAALQHSKQEQARLRQAEVLRQAEESERELKSTLPGWNDDMLQSYSAYAGEHGLTPESAERALLTPGFWRLIHKAKAYDDLQKKKAEMKPVKELPKVQKPSGQNQPPQLAKRQEAMKRHKANPSLNSLAALL